MKNRRLGTACPGHGGDMRFLDAGTLPSSTAALVVAATIDVDPHGDRVLEDHA